MSNADTHKRDSIQAELKSIESKNGVACDREQLHRRADAVKAEIETVGDPVVKSEFSRRLSVLRGKA